jgi:hypothetical protein
MNRTLSSIVALMLAAGPAAAQVRHFGTEAFRAVLRSADLKSIPEGRHVFDEPENRVIVLFGQTSSFDREMRDLAHFVGAGGAVLIATDRRTPPGMSRYLGVAVSGETVNPPVEGDHNYRRMPECPFVWEVNRVPSPTQKSAGFLFQGLRTPPEVATNLPSKITEFRDVIPLATLYNPGEVVQQAVGRLRGPPLRDQSLFAVMGTPMAWNKGKLLVLADQSVFINDMMLAGDNDNIQFAFNVANWLTDAGDGHRRKQCVFFEDGRLEQNFDVSLDYTPSPMPPLQALVPMADETIAAVERDNFFNKLLLELAGGPLIILRTILFILTLGLLCYGLYRFMQSRYRPESRLPRDDTPAVNGGLTTAERRHQAVLAHGNLAEAARELAHQAFLSIGLTPTAETPPPAVVVTGWFGGRRWPRLVRKWWKLAVRGPSRRVSPAALERLDKSLHKLLAAVASGRVRLATASSAI